MLNLGFETEQTHNRLHDTSKNNFVCGSDYESLVREDWNIDVLY